MLPEKMKSVAVVEMEQVDILETGLPKVLNNDILIKVRGTMLCTFEQRIFRRVFPMPLPFVPGHEVVGEVAAVGEGVNPDKYPIGQKVVAKLLYSCGECDYCREGHENLCEERSKAVQRAELKGMGALGQYMSVDARQVWKVANDLEDDIAVFAEPVACVVNSIKQGRVEFGDDVLVIGGGIMGQLHVMLSKLKGARVIMSEPDEKRRELALKLGADMVVNPMEEDLKEYILEHTNDYGVDVVFNTTAVSEVAAQSITVMGAHARNVAYSSQHPDKPFPISANWIHDKEPIITGAVSPTIDSFNKSVKLLNKRILDPRILIDAQYPMEEAQTAFKEALRPDTFRIKINFIEE